MTWWVDDIAIENADQLLRLYVDTDDNTPRMQQLSAVRDALFDNLEEVSSAAEVTGLIHWYLRDQQIVAHGETLDETADRLSDIDIEQDTDQYTDLIFRINIAIERLDDIMLAEL